MLNTNIKVEKVEAKVFPPLPEGLDYVKAFEGIEEYEHYLWDMIN